MSVIENLVAQLEQYRAANGAQSDTVDRFIDFLEKNRLQSFDRSLAEGHVTASCWLINKAQTDVLLTHHRKLNCWIQPGGHADGERDLVKVALTEAHEESGIEKIAILSDEFFDIDRHVIPERRNEPEHFHYDFRFAMQSTENDSYIVSDESYDLNWVEITRLAHFASDESVLRMGQKWLSRSVNVSQ
jgi:8-oxo-dGTP pyrophosphatase MutT (NUDIX family)